jgi:hypothetical protein
MKLNMHLKNNEIMKVVLNAAIENIGQVNIAKILGIFYVISNGIYLNIYYY